MKLSSLPAFRVVFLEPGVEVVIRESLRAVRVEKDRARFRVLPEVLDVDGSMSALQRSQVAGTPVLALP